MRYIADDVGETIARSRKVIQQARDAMARADLTSEEHADRNPKRANPD